MPRRGETDNSQDGNPAEQRPARPRRHWRVVRLITLWSLVVSLCYWLDHNNSLFQWLEQRTVAARMRQWSGRNSDLVKQARKQIVLVPFTDATFEDPTFAPYHQLPIPRVHYVKVINELKDAGAKVIVFDILFDASRPGDRQFAAAARRFKNVVWGAVYDGETRELIKPNPTLLAASPFAGHVSSPYEGDQTPFIDRVDAVVNDQGTQVPALSIQAVRLAMGQGAAEARSMPGLFSAGKLVVPLDERGRFRIAFFGEHHDTLAQVPFDQIYNGAARLGMFRDQGFFKDKIVLIGDLTPITRDFYQTPIGRMSGLEAHAYAVSTLLQRSYLREVPSWLATLLFFALPALTSWLAVSRRWLPAFLFIVGAIGAFLVAALYLFATRNLLLPMAAPAMTALFAAAATMIERGWTEERERARITTVLQQYVSEQIAQNGAPTGEVALLFTDLEGSTQLSRRMGVQFEKIRDEHFRILRNAAKKWHGFEVETAGDSIYLVFGKASDAVRFAVDAQRDLANHKWPKTVTHVRVRMGIHFGQPFVGRDRARLTYRGPETNRTARVMGAAQGGQVLVTEECRAAAKAELPPDISFEPAGTHSLKGIGEETLYQVSHPAIPMVAEVRSEN